MAMSSELRSEAARYRRIARDYARKAGAAEDPSDKNMYTCLADGYTRLARAYEDDAEIFKPSLSFGDTSAQSELDKAKERASRRCR
jgi:hypothetical protein